MSALYKSIVFRKFTDQRGGALFPVGFDELGFTPANTYFVKDVPKDVVRGDHAHHKTIQGLVCLQGQVEIKLTDGQQESVFMLNVNEGIVIPPKVWSTQRYLTGNDILFCLVSFPYEE